VDNLLKESSSPNAETITKTIKDKLNEFDLDLSSLSSFVSDGASVMVGSRSGVVARLKETNPCLIAVHCICHL